MKETLLQNWQFLTLLLAMFGTWLSLLTIAKGDMRELRGEMRELKIDLKQEISELTKLVQHFIDLHINHEGRISKIEEKTKKL